MVINIQKKADRTVDDIVFHPTIIIIALSIAVTASVICFSYLNAVSASRAMLKSEERKIVDLALHRTNSELSSAYSDGAYLAENEFLRTWLVENSPVLLGTLAREYAAFMKQRSVYDQIRLIGLDGHEIIRVNQENGKPRIVHGDLLQDKSSRHYVKEALALRRDEIYLSAFDLNVENGTVELPIKPMIRIATPVFDEDGRKRGIVVLNYKGQRLLDGVRALRSSADGHPWLINSDGQWLAGPVAEAEWSFMFPERGDRSFARAFPDAWKVIARAGHAQQFELGGDLVTVSRISQPGRTAAGKAQRRTVAAEDWLIVSRVPKTFIQAQNGTIALRLAGIFVIASLMQGLAAWLVYRHWRARRFAEQVSDESEAISDAIAANVADAVIAIDEKGVIRSFNRSAETSFGYSAEEARGQNVAMLMPEPYQSLHDGYMASFLETGRRGIIGVGPRELIGLRKDGTTFPLELAIAEAKVGERRIFVGAVRDISVRKAAEIAARQSEERFRVAFDAAPHGMALVGIDGRWLRANRAVCDMLGYSEQELRSLDFQAVTHPDDLSADLKLVDDVIAGKMRSYQMEKRYIRRDGSIVPVLLSVSIVRDDDGQPMHFISQLVDLSERNEMEAQLVQAQKMEAVGQLTGGIAHDFNNLLTVILGNARLLQRRLGDEESVTKKLHAIVGAAQRGSNLTQRLLAFSRKEKLEPKLVDGRELLFGMLDMMRRTLGETITIETHYGAGPLTLMVDPNLLEAALLNLATNARDAMPNGGTLTINLDREMSSPDGEGWPRSDFVVISVSDTGCGISPDNLTHVFEPFFTTKDVGRGSGLGLSMVFGFVQQSGGHVSVDSKLGSGTQFRIHLPAAEGEVQRVDIQPEQALLPEKGSGTILVVEDEPGVRAIAVSVLEELGYSVIQAGNGADALAELERLAHVDLLFTDIVMPGQMTGLDLAEQARRRYPELKVLYTSGYSSGVNTANSTLPEEITILSKPYEAADLAIKVSQAVNA